MKKICCSLLLLLFTFVCLFATIPKNKVSADTIVPSSYNYAINYFAPRITTYNFNGNRLVVNNELVSGLYGTGASYVTYNSRTVFNEEGAPMNSFEYSGIYTQYNEISNPYWTVLDGSKDYTFIDRYNFSTIGFNNNDLVVTLTFDTHFFDLEFLESNNQFFGVQLPFMAGEYVVEYDYNVSGFDENFDYIKNGVNWSGANYYRTSFSNTVSLEFYQNNFTYVDFMAFSEISNYIRNDLVYVSDGRPVTVDGTVRIYIDDWEAVLLDAPNFSYIRKTHPFASYQEYPENGGSIIPGFNIGQNMKFLPGGLPSGDGSGGGVCEDDGFIEDISTSLLNGVQNFLTFEISPGFSLYHILLLVVAIPLLILILKLFLGG